MRFSDTSTKTGMLQMCEDLLGYNNGQITDSSNLKQRFTRLINDRYNQVSNKIWKMVGDWEFDDTNQTTLPIATADLVANQQDYELPSSAQKLERVEVKNQDGDYVVIASAGHIIDLPEEKINVDIKNDFKPTYAVMDGKKDVVKNIIDCSKRASMVYIATDEDTEGCGIGGHISSIIPKNIPRKIIKIRLSNLHTPPLYSQFSFNK